nr:unnamed protein product [Callosobruchus chinensis]
MESSRLRSYRRAARLFYSRDHKAIRVGVGNAQLLSTLAAMLLAVSSSVSATDFDGYASDVYKLLGRRKGSMYEDFTR